MLWKRLLLLLMCRLAVRGRGNHLQPLCLWGQLVILRREEIVGIANRLEEDVQARLTLYAPKDAPVLEPGMRKYSIYSSKDVGQLAYLRVLCRLVGAES